MFSSKNMEIILVRRRTFIWYIYLREVTISSDHHYNKNRLEILQLISR